MGDHRAGRGSRDGAVVSAPMTYLQAVRKAASEILVSNMRREAWIEIGSELGKALKDLAWATLVLIVRLALVLLSPVSIPLIAMLIRYDEHKSEKQRATMVERWHSDREKLVKKATTE